MPGPYRSVERGKATLGERGQAARLHAVVRDREHGVAHHEGAADRGRAVVLDAPGRVDPAAAADAEADRVLLERDHHEPGSRPEEEGVVVVLGLRPALAEVARV